MAGGVIFRLPQQVANQIAAGEVIQRPASAVKELIENSVDAGATEIKIQVKDAGKTLIKIVDNGEGIAPQDIELAFQRHATSKIKTTDDLTKIMTKGFRGEALASIASVAQIEIISKKSTNQLGTLLCIEGGEVKRKEQLAAQNGTTISVKNLFFNTPVRRNFLKTNQTELRRILEEVYRLAIAHCYVRFDVFDQGSELLHLTKATVKHRLRNIFGTKLRDNLLEINSDTQIAKISGYVLKPNISKQRGNPQYFFVNNRFIKAPYLRHAVLEAYQGLLPEKSQPGYFIFIEIATDKIDVNIHPTKTEIKFEESENLYAILKSTVKHSLGIHRITPPLDFNQNPDLRVPYEYKDKPPTRPTIPIDTNYNPFEDARQKNVLDFQNTPSNNPLKIENISDLLDIKAQPSIFQLFSKYIVCGFDNNLIIINQNRAHQRILFEKFKKGNKTNSLPSQQLIFPIIVSLSIQQTNALKEIEDDLKKIGFRIKIVNKTSIQILGAPQICPTEKISATLEELLDQTIDVSSHTDTIGDMIAKFLARKWAITNNQLLNHVEQNEMVNNLFACQDYGITPFNKKVFIRLDKGALNRKLE